MKALFRFLIAASLGSGILAAGLRAQQQPVIGVAIEAVNVGGVVDGAVDPYGTSFTGGTTFNPPNESFGPAGVPINIAGLATGTFLQGSFTYSFFVNGISIGVTPSPVGPPHRAVVTWTPPQPGSYFLTVVATDGVNTATSLPVRYFATGTVVNSPLTNTIVPQGSSVVLKADATIGGGFIKQIQFFADGQPIGQPDTTIPYSLIYTPPGTPGTITNITAQAIDNTNTAVTMSAPVSLRTVQRIDPLPTSVISTPQDGAVIPISTEADINIIVDANSATGLISKVELYIDGVLFGTRNAYPYTFDWQPSVVGTYHIAALTYDDKNNVVASPVSTIVIATPPSVAIVTPAAGSTVTGGSSTTLRATATTSNFSADGTPFEITSVQFFADGKFLGRATTESSPNTYSINATLTQSLNEEGEPVPTVLTALATDSGGLNGVSSPVAVTVTAGGTGTGSGGGEPEAPPVVLDSTAGGIISGPGTTGRFVATSARGKTVTFIGETTTNGVTSRHVFTDVPVAANGQFSATDDAGKVTINGTFSSTGAFGQLDNGRLAFSGALALPGLIEKVGSGYYVGNLEGRPTSTVTGIVGADGSLVLHVVDGSFVASAFGAVDAAGNFDIATDNAGVRIQGTADPVSGFLRATIHGGPGGTLLAATSGDQLSSDGFLRNLSTRGQVGTGDNTLVAGFVVNGTQPKPVLIRVLGPSLAAAGITAPLANPYVQVLNSSGAIVAENDNWETPIGPAPATSSAISATSSGLGAGVLPSGSLEAVVLATLSPGVYTAHVTGVGGGSGVALVELYDAGTQSAYSAQKLINVSTRGRVGVGEAQLIAGFVVNGKRSKKVLIRAAGPSLGAVAPSLAPSVLGDPKLRLVRIGSSGNTLVRENDNWETGNDAAQVVDVASQVGAFAFTSGSKDAAILVNLPPGVYTAQVTGEGSSTGLALVEVYEAP